MPPSLVRAFFWASRHLRLQLMRFTRLTLALVAYHTDPEWVDDVGDAALDDPVQAEYVRAVLATLSWLCETKPWRGWDACPVPDVTAPVEPIDWEADHA